MNGIKERDYLNFFEMLKFWITQTDNNITNNGKRVSKSYLDKNNIGDVGKYFKDPLFKEEYIKFNDKYLKINFVDLFPNLLLKGTTLLLFFLNNYFIVQKVIFLHVFREKLYHFHKPENHSRKYV